MILERIILSNFRNYPSADITFHPEVTCLTGLNGMGKTNLLDALYYLSMTKSYLSAQDNQVVRFQADFFRLEGHYFRGGQREKIVAKVLPHRSKEFSSASGPVSRLSDHVGYLPIVFITPDDVEILTGGSELRRKFLDNTLSQTDNSYLRHLIQYNRLLTQRNALLRNVAKDSHTDLSLLEVYDEQMLPSASYIHGARRDFSVAFNPIFAEKHHAITCGREVAAIDYDSNLSNANYRELLEKSRQRDFYMERTSEGIHKDDLILRLDGQLVRKFASQGQKKSFLIALKLGQAAYLKAQSGLHPMLLLDDIFDKLDPDRVESLIACLVADMGGQIFLTDTHPQRVPDILRRLDVHHLHGEIREGSFYPLS